MSKSNRPYSLPPTNVQMSNDYVGIDRGLFLTRTDNSFLRVTEAEWHTYGPNTSPGILRFKLGKFKTQPSTPASYNTPTKLKDLNGNEWFEVATSGPNFRPVMVEYWAKFIYYHYYSGGAFIEPITLDYIDGLKEAGESLTKSLATFAKIDSILNVAKYKVSNGKPLELISYTSTAVVGGNPLTVDSKVETLDDKFDPVLNVIDKLRPQ